MSVFHDFQKAWATRFPGCDLPQAWEEDVRTNLANHLHKVKLLKEELEKEQFYVEFLERLLAHVEKCKHNAGKENKAQDEPEDSTEAKAEKNETAKISLSQSKKSEIQHGGSGATEVGCLSSVTSTSTPFTNEEGVSDDRDVNNLPKLVERKTESVSATTLNDVPTTSDVEQSSFQTKANQYITGIKVNGYAAESAAKTKTVVPSKQEEAKSVSQSHGAPSTRSKVPPKPPPKRSKPSVGSLSDASSLQGETNVFPEISDKTLKSDSLASSNESIRSSSCTTKSTESFELTSRESSTLETVVSGDEQYLTSAPSMQNPQEGKDSTSDVANGISNPPSCDFSSQVPTSPSGEAKSNENLESEGDYFLFSDKNSEYDDHTMKSQTSNHSEYSSQSGLSDMDGVLASSPVPPDDNHKDCDYENIDFFLRRKARQKQCSSSQGESAALDSDDEENELLANLASDPEEDCDQGDGNTAPSGTDDVFDIDSGVYSSSVESTSCLNSLTPVTPPPGKKGIQSPPSNSLSPTAKSEENGINNKAEAERITMYKCIINSILESETIYLECLNILLQYMKVLRATISTSQPVISQEDFNAIFYKIPELHSMHEAFLEGIRNRRENWDGKLTIGDNFKILASKLGVYVSFLQNYSHAIETVRKCSAEKPQFSELTKIIKLKSLNDQAVSLEDLLHKPVARVQKNALVLHDLLKFTPKSHPDHKTLTTALKMTQCFLNDFNMSATESMFPSQDRTQRHLVKNSFIVELSEGHRKLRHLFLFNDVIVCAKFKASGRDKCTFEVKWYIPLTDVVLPSGEDTKDVRENSPVSILSLKSQASSLRDQILREEKIQQSKDKQRLAGRNIDKQRKKLAELEAQLVLCSPNLLFRIAHRHGKTYTFFLSSEYERSQWSEAITTLQATALTANPSLSLYELQNWITTCRQFLKTNMGNFLFRSGKDDLLVGDLHILIHSLQGLTRPADLFVCLEVDSYGHYFRKAKTKVCHDTTEPVWGQDFIVELEGSQSLRILCYEENPQQGVILHSKTTLELNRHWLSNQLQEKAVSIQEFVINISIQFVPLETSLKRTSSGKPCGLFGVKINQVCKKEKRQVPFIITSCVREVEKRGMSEVGIYRVSGSASDVQKLKKTFETNAYEAEQLLKEVDIHSVTGLLKLYLRDLPEALFTDELYPKFFDAFSTTDVETKKHMLLSLFSSLPQINQTIIAFLIDHMVRINQQEGNNKMSLHNLATVFGPTLLRPGTKCDPSSPSDLLAARTIDVMAQAGILYFFLKRKAAGESINAPVE